MDSFDWERCWVRFSVRYLRRFAWWLELDVATLHLDNLHLVLTKATLVKLTHKPQNKNKIKTKK